MLNLFMENMAFAAMKPLMNAFMENDGQATKPASKGGSAPGYGTGTTTGFKPALGGGDKHQPMFF